MDERALDIDNILESSSSRREYQVLCSERSVPSAADHWITDCGSFHRAGQLQSYSLWNICRQKSCDYCKGGCLMEYHLLLWGEAHQCRIKTKRSPSMWPLTIKDCGILLWPWPVPEIRCWARQANEQSIAQRCSLKYGTRSKTGSLPLRRRHTQTVP